MNNLSCRQAARCENACTPRCKCRCGGVFHGRARSNEDVFFESLPADDPHYVVSKEAAKAARRKARRRQLELFTEE